VRTQLAVRTSWTGGGTGSQVSCERHGGPAAGERARRQRPARWLVAIARFVLPLAVSLFGPRIVSREWPFCDECSDERNVRQTVGLALIAVAPLPQLSIVITAPVAAFAPGSGEQVIVSWVAGGLLLAAGLAMLTRAAWQTLCGALISRNGEWLLIGRPDRPA
jgi:hypothetical protein